MTDENFEDQKPNWPQALIGTAFLVFLLLVCFGSRILDWLGAPS